MKKQNKISKTAGNVKAGRSALALLLTLTLVFSPDLSDRAAEGAGSRSNVGTDSGRFQPDWNI